MGSDFATKLAVFARICQVGQRFDDPAVSACPKPTPLARSGPPRPAGPSAVGGRGCWCAGAQQRSFFVVGGSAGSSAGWLANRQPVHRRVAGLRRRPWFWIGHSPGAAGQPAAWAGDASPSVVRARWAQRRSAGVELAAPPAGCRVGKPTLPSLLRRCDRPDPAGSGWRSPGQPRLQPDPGR